MWGSCKPLKPFRLQSGRPGYNPVEYGNLVHEYRMLPQSMCRFEENFLLSLNVKWKVRINYLIIW
jgi:hypothetical protein